MKSIVRQSAVLTLCVILLGWSAPGAGGGAVV
jgi:hypothetical protein